MRNEQHEDFIDFVLVETLMHQAEIGTAIRAFAGEKPNATLRSLLDEIETQRTTLRRFADGRIAVRSAATRKLEATAGELFARELRSSRGAEQLMLAYDDALGLPYPTGAYISGAVELLASWRQQYVSCEVDIELSSGTLFSVGGSISQLFEMWCFFEMCLALKQCSMIDVVQRSFIRSNRREPEFRIGGSHYAVFDYNEARFRAIDDSDAAYAAVREQFRTCLRGARVEWFVANRCSPRNSMVMDAKYSEWKSGEALKVLGYMLNYGVRRGAVIFNGEVDECIVGGVAISPGVIRLTCPHDSGVVLWVLSMQPDPAFAERNVDVMREFVLDAFTGTNLRGE